MERDGGNFKTPSGQEVSLDQIQRAARLLLPDRPDLAAEVGQNAALNISQYKKHIDNVDAFIFRTVRNEVYDILSKKKKQKELHQKLEEEAPHLLARRYQRESQLLFNAAVCLELLGKIDSQLSQPQREILLDIYQGFSITEIAERLNIHRGEIYAELAKIRKIIEELEPDPDPDPASPDGGGSGHSGNNGGVSLPPVRAGPQPSMLWNDTRRVAASPNTPNSKLERTASYATFTEEEFSEGDELAGSRHTLPQLPPAPQSTRRRVPDGRQDGGRVRGHPHGRGNDGTARVSPAGSGVPGIPEVREGDDMGKAQPGSQTSRGGGVGQHGQRVGAETVAADLKRLLLQLPAFREAGLAPTPGPAVGNLGEVVARVLRSNGDLDDQ